MNWLHYQWIMMTIRARRVWVYTMIYMARFVRWLLPYVENIGLGFRITKSYDDRVLYWKLLVICGWVVIGKKSEYGSRAWVGWVW